MEKSKEPRILSIDPFAQSYAYPSVNYKAASYSSGSTAANGAMVAMKSVVDVEWSHSRADVIAVSTTNQKYVSLFR